MLGATNYSRFGNCSVQDDTALAALPVEANGVANFVDEYYELSDIEKTSIYMEALRDSCSEYTNDVLTYISGYIHRKIQVKEQCVDCAVFMENAVVRKSSTFLRFVDRGKLTYPIKDLEQVVRLSHGLLKNFESKKKILSMKKTVDILTVRVIDILSSKNPGIFSYLNSHTDSNSLVSHKISMIKKIVSIFFTLKLRHLCRSLNENVFDKNIRRIMTKTVCFKINKL